MDKKLPKVFVNEVNVSNNNNVFHINKSESNLLSDSKNVLEKINKIFGSSRYVYKADVLIKTKNKLLTKKVIGRNKNNLITMDNEIIPINDIVDIEFKKNNE